MQVKSSWKGSEVCHTEPLFVLLACECVGATAQTTRQYPPPQPRLSIALLSVTLSAHPNPKPRS